MHAPSSRHDPCGIHGVVAGQQVADYAVPAHHGRGVHENDVARLEAEVGGQYVSNGAAGIEVVDFRLTIGAAADHVHLAGIARFGAHAARFAQCRGQRHVAVVHDVCGGQVDVTHQIHLGILATHDP